MRLLLSGGCKNGKSTLAQCIAQEQGGALAYVATMHARDEEDMERVRRHQAERQGLGFETVECASKIERITGMLSRDASVLLDSTTALLAEEMFAKGPVDPWAPERVMRGLLPVLRHFPNLVIVSDYLYADGISYGTSTEMYRRGLATIDAGVAAWVDGVVEMVYGQPVLHKGDEQVVALVNRSFARASHGAWAVHSAAGLLHMDG